MKTIHIFHILWCHDQALYFTRGSSKHVSLCPWSFETGSCYVVLACFKLEVFLSATVIGVHLYAQRNINPPFSTSFNALSRVHLK